LGGERVRLLPPFFKGLFQLCDPGPNPAAQRWRGILGLQVRHLTLDAPFEVGDLGSKLLQPRVRRRRLLLPPRVGQPATPVVLTLGAEQRCSHEPHHGLVQHRLAEVDARWVSAGMFADRWWDGWQL
jgi:hypothetical protein